MVLVLKIMTIAAPFASDAITIGLMAITAAIIAMQLALMHMPLIIVLSQTVHCCKLVDGALTKH